MRKISVFLFVALCVAAVSFAAPMAKHYVTGTVQSIDTAAKTITVSINNTNKTFTLSDKTAYLKNGGKASAKMEDVKLGDKVSVDADSKNVVRRIIVSSAAPAAQPTAASKTPATPHR